MKEENFAGFSFAGFSKESLCFVTQIEDLNLVKKSMHLAIAKFAYEKENTPIPKTDEDYIIEAQMQNSNPRQIGKNTYFSPVEAHDLDAVHAALQCAEEHDFKGFSAHVIDAAWYKNKSTRWMQASPADVPQAIKELKEEWL